MINGSFGSLTWSWLARNVEIWRAWIDPGCIVLPLSSVNEAFSGKYTVTSMMEFDTFLHPQDDKIVSGSTIGLCFSSSSVYVSLLARRWYGTKRCCAGHWAEGNGATAEHPHCLGHPLVNSCLSMTLKTKNTKPSDQCPRSCSFSSSKQALVDVWSHYPMVDRSIVT